MRFAADKLRRVNGSCSKEGPMGGCVVRCRSYTYAMRRAWFLGFGFLAACGDTIIYEIAQTQGDGGGSAVVTDGATADAGQPQADASTAKDAADSATNAADGGVTDGSQDAAPMLDGALDSAPGDGATVDASTDSSASDAGPLDAADAKSDAVFVFDTGSPSVDGSALPDACAQAAVEAKPIGIDLYVVLDKSGSMHGPVSTWQAAKGDCNIGDTVDSKWCKSINALATYFASPSPNGNRAALNFFSGTLAASQCGGALYSTPQVPIQGFVPLPDSSAFTTVMNNETPGGETPTEAALRGIVQYTGSSATYTPGRQRVGVLVTDGYPTSCETSASKLAAIADTHYTNTAVPIFMVGMDGADFTHLETMAVGGHAAVHAKNAGGLTNACGNGKSQCQSWNIGDGNNNALTVALEQIQYEAAACSFAIPTSDGGIIDPKTANVEYLQGGTITKSLTHVTGASSCTSAGGFYFDNNVTPTTIKLCPTSCDLVRADSKAKVQVKLGCEGS